MEGALKLKEITYIHGEGYAAGELKHGPLALIEDDVPVVVVVPRVKATTEHSVTFRKLRQEVQV